MSYILLLISAVIFIFPFFYSGLYIFSWIGLIPALYSLLNKREKGWKSFIKGWLLGIILNLGVGYWLYIPLNDFTGLSFLAIILVLFILFVIFGLIYGLWAYSLVKIQRNNKFHPFLLAISWVAMEYFKFKILNVFPLGYVGYSQSNFNHLIQLAEYGGVFLISFIVLLINGYLYRLIFLNHKKSLVALIVILILVLGCGSFKINNIEENSKELMKVGIIPTRISQKEKWLPYNREENMDLIFEKINLVENNDIDLVITPETSFTFDITRNEYYRNIFKQKMESVDTFLQIGAQAVNNKESNQYGKSNSSFLLDERGEIINRYNKNKLVLFGEYIPFENLVNQLAGTGLNSLVPGDKIMLFEKNNISWKTVICSEILNPIFVKEKARAADFIVNQSNEAWFENSNLENQMWAAARFRVIENRLPVIKAGNYAYNGIIYPDGKNFKKRSNETEAFTVNIRSSSTSQPTFYQKWGNYPGYISLVIWIFFIIIKLYAWLSERKKENKTN
ncbi:MAG: apolipoprotein N-acyltransferase [Bacillota bacterium]